MPFVLRHCPLMRDSFNFMAELKQFPDHRYVGDKRTQLVYDLQADSHTDAIADLAESEQFICFAPDTLAEARNRGYRLAK